MGGAVRDQEDDVPEVGEARADLSGGHRTGIVENGEERPLRWCHGHFPRFSGVDGAAGLTGLATSEASARRRVPA